MPKKILIAAANHWNSPYQVGSHHYARVFAQNGWDVLFVSDPISPLHFLAKRDEQLKERYKIYKGLYENDISNIHTYVPLALITPNEKPVFNTKFVAEQWHNLTVPNIVKYAKKMGFGEVDILWFDSISQKFWIDLIKYKKSVFRVSDKLDAFKKINKNMKILEHELLDKADIVIYTARSLEPYISKYTNKASFIPNGVDVSNFINSSREIPADLQSIPSPRVIYIGAIDEWFDTELLYDVAKKLSDASFVLIGSPNTDIDKFKKRPNIYFLGRRKYHDIPGYLYNCDAGIIPFNKRHPVVNSVNPIKLYEYMICGLPTVATDWEELKLLKSPAYLAKDAVEFSELLRLALRDKDKEKLINFAGFNTWEERFKKIIYLCNNYPDISTNQY
jgi:glycosyltransferase involved in cell wall biosynthesis